MIATLFPEVLLGEASSTTVAPLAVAIVGVAMVKVVEWRGEEKEEERKWVSLVSERDSLPWKNF